MHTGDVNFPQPSPGPLLRTGKAWEKHFQAVPGIQGSGLVSVRHGGSPLVDTLGNCEVGTGVIRKQGKALTEFKGRPPSFP